MRKIGLSSAAAPKLPQPDAVHRELLLYVEDNDDNWGVAELRLRRAYELLRAPSSREACRLLRERGDEIAAILMDIELRGSELNGIELTELLRGKSTRKDLPDYARAVTPMRIPIIFVTAHGAKYSDTVLLLAGGDRVISKPIDFSALSLALTQLHLSRAAKNRRKP